MGATATQVDYFRLELLCVLEGPGARVLTFALKCGTNITSPIHLDHYLNNLPQGSTAFNYSQLPDRTRKIKMQFDKSQIDQIKQDPLWETFDITLLYKSIRLACRNVAGLNGTEWQNPLEMEGLLNKIKEERNKCVHERPQMTEPQFLAKVDDLRNLYFDVLEAVKARYSVPDQEIIDVKDKVEREIKDIKKAFTPEMILQMSFHKQLILFKEETKRHLKYSYEKAQYFDPLCFLSGSTQTRLHIQSVFSKVVLKDKTKGATPDTEIDCLDLLSLTQSIRQIPQPPQPSTSSQPPQPSTSSQPPQPSTSSQPPQPSTSSQPPQPSTSSQPPQPTWPQLIMVSGVAGSGKTTLITFILSEWLKDQQNRRINHIDQYDIVLRILCRETDGPSLQEYLEWNLPAHLNWLKNSFVKFLTECKVLFMIDGLDERNGSSRQLVNDILRIGKNMSEFTIMCTSRPEYVEDFLAQTRDNYQQWETEMARIPDNERSDFVLKHYDLLPPHRSKDPVGLRNLMDTIGWEDNFGLPLNLLFVATLFNDDPGCIKQDTSQSRLYHIIHEWCLDKLQHRLAANQHEGILVRKMRERKIKKVLKIMYMVELQGLFEERLYLSDEDIEQLLECCETQKLPPEELLAAFFSLRKSVASRRVSEKYYAPHKGLQEFYAAMHILQHVEDNPIQGAVRCVLQDFMKVTSLNLTNLTKVEDLRNTRILLLHLVNLLSYRENSLDVTPLPTVIEEVVELLAETRIKRCEDWLYILADTEVNTTVLDHVVHHVTSNPVDNDIILITDSTVISAAALLPRVPQAEIWIKLHRPSSNVIKLKTALKRHNCTSLALHYDYQHPDTTPASDLVLRDLPMCNIDWFVGHLSADGVQWLPESLVDLHLAVSDDQHACNLLLALHLALSGPSLPMLETLCIHVPLMAVTPSALTTPLPDVPVTTAAAAATPVAGAAATFGNDADDEYSCVYLVLSGLEKNLMDLACQVASALEPRARGYCRIGFFSKGMEAAEWRDMLTRLAAVGVRVRDVFIPVTIKITEEEEDELSTLAKEKLGCIFVRQTINMLWTV